MKVHQSMKTELEEKTSQVQEAEKRYNRKVAENREEKELETQAKQHLQESYTVMLDEKDEKLRVLQTQVGVGPCVCMYVCVCVCMYVCM